MTASASLVGRTLAGRFRLTEFIGEGAMASVYRGTQDKPARDVAVKVLHPHLASDATFVARFHREAAAAARIAHPNSVKVLDHGADGDFLFIAMELLAGRDLFETLVREKRLGERRAAWILMEVLDALAAAHAVGIVHRDLKPENIMLVSDPSAEGGERVKVLDFGIAKMLEKDMDGPGGVMLTTIGTLVGTPAYMSPEQCTGEPVEARSDLYAVGVVLYQLVTGSLPFTADAPFDFVLHHLKTVPAPPTHFVPEIHPRLQELILQALAKKPEDRPVSAAQLRNDLAAILPELREGALPLGTVGGRPSMPAPFSLDPASQRFIDARAATLEAPAMLAPRLPHDLPAPKIHGAGGDDPHIDSLSPRVLSVASPHLSVPKPDARPPGDRVCSYLGIAIALVAAAVIVGFVMLGFR